MAIQFNRALTRPFIKFVLPSIASGTIALAAFVVIGQTPLIRAAGLALMIAAMTLTLRRMGAALSLVGALVLAFSPLFWSQAGGPPSGLPVMALVLLVTIAAAFLIRRFGQFALLIIEIALLIIAVVFWESFSAYHSLRITTLCAALVLFLLIDGLLRTNPRPEEDPPIPLDDLHTAGLLLLFTVGVLNDPLFTLFAPAISLGLLLTRTKLPAWYWIFVILVAALGVYGIVTQYVTSVWWLYPATQAENLRVPYILSDAWREPSRWVMLIQLVVLQFTPIGILLSVFGLARLSRWYPPLGTVTLVAYATYVLFGLVYYGTDGPVLLLPLLMLHIVWMTYGVFTLGQWIQKALQPVSTRWIAPAAFSMLVLIMLARIVGIM